MKKTTWILPIMCLLFNIAEINCIVDETNETENSCSKLQLINIHNASISRNIPSKITSLEINARELHNSSVEIHLPLCVKKISLQGSEWHNSEILLYAKHSPEIAENIREMHNSSIRTLHPIRKYTYHLAALAALGALAYYFTSKK